LFVLGPSGPSAAWAQPKAGADKAPPAKTAPAKAAPAKAAPAKAAPAKAAPADSAKPADGKKAAPAPAGGDAAKPAGDAAAPPADGKKDAAGDQGKAEESKAPGTPPPPTPEQIEEAKKAFLEGKRLFDEAKDYKGAVEQFKKSYRLSRNPLLLYNVGYTLDQMNEKSMAIFYYEKFLKDTKPGALNRDLAKERLKALGREVEADAVFEGGGATGTEGTSKTETTKTDKTETTKPAAPEITTFQHNVIEEAPPGKPLDVTAFVPEKAKWQVMLFYRGQGARKFTSVPMRPRYNELVGRIPAQVMAGTSVQYYIEARDATGALVDRSGRSTSPNLVFINPKAKPSYYPDLTSERSWEGAGTTHITPGGGSGLGGGGQPTGTGGWTDVQSRKYQYLKWGTTATAVGLLAFAVGFNVIATNAASGLEGEAFNSTDVDECAALGGPPCRSFADRQKSFQARGEYYETAYQITLGLGLVTAGVAGYFWYKEIAEKKKAGAGASAGAGQPTSTSTAITATPVVGKDFVGGAATLRF